MKKILRIAGIFIIAIILVGFTSYGVVVVEKKDFHYSREVMECLCLELNNLGYRNTWEGQGETLECFTPGGLFGDDIFISLAHETDSEMVINIHIDHKKKRYKGTFKEINPDGFTKKGYSHIKKINLILSEYNLPIFKIKKSRA